MKTTDQNLQVKLSLDEGLQNIWTYLTREYEGMDKAGIIRLALNNLAKTTKKYDEPPMDILDIIEELKRNEKGMTEKEFFAWWNKNKGSL